MRRAWSLVACAALATCAPVGCRFALVSADWWALRRPARTDAEQASSTGRKPAPKTVPVEIVFARAADHEASWQDELWGLADEQAFDGDLRGRLAANGLRVGVLTGPLPPHLASRLEPSAVTGDDHVPTPADRPAVVRRFLKLLPGRDNEVVAAAGLDELVLLEHDGTDVHGATYHDATAYFALRAWPAADGRVRIDLVPTVKHGPLERSWVGDDGAFRLETGQKRQPLGRLAVTATMPLGSTLLVGTIGDASSTVGDAFFRDRSGPQFSRRLLAIRPEGRTADPLFSSDRLPPAPAGGEPAADAPAPTSVAN